MDTDTDEQEPTVLEYARFYELCRPYDEELINTENVKDVWNDANDDGIREEGLKKAVDGLVKERLESTFHRERWIMYSCLFDTLKLTSNSTQGGSAASKIGICSNRRCGGLVP